MRSQGQVRLALEVCDGVPICARAGPGGDARVTIGARHAIATVAKMGVRIGRKTDSGRAGDSTVIRLLLRGR